MHERIKLFLVKHVSTPTPNTQLIFSSSEHPELDESQSNRDSPCRTPIQDSVDSQFYQTLNSKPILSLGFPDS